ncbi:MAG: efflux RND transporter permease subunit [Halioglobus sp.]
MHAAWPWWRRYAHFRAIILTSLTTFIGLVPMLMSRSAQAESMVPDGLSLAFGILFATVIALLLVPCLYMILEDLDHWWRNRAGAASGALAQLGEPRSGNPR